MIVQAFDLRMTADITFGHIQECIAALTRRFNEEFGSTEYLFEKDYAVEGGFRLVSWPNSRASQYKAIRFAEGHWDRSGVFHPPDYPGDIDTNRVCFKKQEHEDKERRPIVLKVLHDFAPMWTHREAQLIAQVLTESLPVRLVPRSMCSQKTMKQAARAARCAR